MPTTVVWHPACRLHYAGAGHPERPQRIEAVLEALRAPVLGGTIRWVEAKPGDRATIERAHPPAYVDALERLAEQGGGMLDGDTIMGPRSWEAALAAAGVALAGTPPKVSRMESREVRIFARIARVAVLSLIIFRSACTCIASSVILVRLSAACMLLRSASESVTAVAAWAWPVMVPKPTTSPATIAKTPSIKRNFMDIQC